MSESTGATGFQYTPEECEHRHPASSYWADVTNCLAEHSPYESEAEGSKVDAHNLKLQEQAYAMAERRDYCLDCGEFLEAEYQHSAKLTKHASGLKYWRV